MTASGAATPTPSWYDILGVSPDASSEEVRTAWRSQIAELDPTDRRFGVLNRAAEVLLDPQRRAAHDAELAATPAADEPSAEQTSERTSEPTREAPPAPDGATASSEAPRGVVPGWLLIGLAVLTVVVAGTAGYFWAKVPSDQSVADATSAAQAAAERAVVPILSYDARHLDQSKAAAEQYLTGDYRSEYDRLFKGVIAQNAPSTGTVVKAALVRSSVVRSGDDRVQVFLLVNQERTNKQSKQPVVYKNWVTVTMEDVDGDWLVAGMDTDT